MEKNNNSFRKFNNKYSGKIYFYDDIFKDFIILVINSDEYDRHCFRSYLSKFYDEIKN